MNFVSFKALYSNVNIKLYVSVFYFENIISLLTILGNIWFCVIKKSGLYMSKRLRTTYHFIYTYFLSSIISKNN